MGKASNYKSLFLKDLVTVINCLSSGSTCKEEVDSVIGYLSTNLVRDPIILLQSLLEKINLDLYNHEINLKSYKLFNEDTSRKSLNEMKEKLSQDFDSDIKSNFYTGNINIVSKFCKNVKCGYRNIEICSDVFPLIEIDNQTEKELNIQKEIERQFLDKHLEGQCEKCGKKINDFLTFNKMIINLPKYLFIKLNIPSNDHNLSNLKRQPLRYFNKYYELVSIIQLNREHFDSNKYYTTIKIDYKWICFNDNDVSLTNSDELFSNCFILVLQMK